jgi:hypothetical protein
VRITENTPTTSVDPRSGIVTLVAALDPSGEFRIASGQV